MTAVVLVFLIICSFQKIWPNFEKFMMKSKMINLLPKKNKNLLPKKNKMKK